ncbi:MAG: restriction endonuclease subunit S [Acidilobaceae archaeon]|jgi:type I restriction enzyme S subunit
MKFRKETEFQKTRIGEIPKEWKLEKLGRLVSYIKGRRPKRLYDEKLSEEFIPYLTAEYMRGLEKPKWCSPKEDPKVIRVQYDDVIMIWDGSYSGHVFTGFEGVLASTMIKIFPSEEIDKRFLYYYLTKNFQKLRGTTVGTGIPHVNKKVFEELLIPLPSLNEQKRIAEILLRVDNAIEGADKAIVKLERLKRGLMSELLTGRIRVREENGRLSFHRETELQETEIGKIPKEWGLAKLEKIAKIITGPFGSQLKKSELTNHGIKVYTQENVLERNFEIGNLYISEEKFKELKNFEVMPDDVLLTIRGTIGKSIKVPTSITKGIIHTNLAIIRLEKKEVLPDFVELVFNESEIWMEQVRRMYSATTIPALYGRTLKQIKIMLPPLNEQKAITHIFSTVNRAIELYREEMTRLERLKRGLMDLLLTGKVRVVDGDVGS